MTFWLKMALASAASRKWILAISLISIGISSAVILSVAQIRADVRNSFASAINGVDLIVGSRDSPTELLMYTVFGLGQASRSMPFSTAQTIAELPGVAWVIPIQLGDFYNDSPVMGTESSFFKRIQVANQALTFASGREFTQENDVVIGSDVAKNSRLAIGEKIILSHGTNGPLAEKHTDSPFQVVGILKATGTPIDRKVIVSLEGFERMHIGWELGLSPKTLQAQLGMPATSPDPSETPKKVEKPSRVTALFVGLTSPARVFGIKRTVERMNGSSLMAVMPGVTLAKLWKMLAIGESALLFVGWLTAVSAMLSATAITMLSLQSRRRELAIWRSLGARPGALLSLVLAESVGIMLAGVVLGHALLQLLIFAGSSDLRALTGVGLHHSLPTKETWAMLMGLIVTAFAAGFIPAIQAYRWSLQDSLNPKTSG
ncbi:ABC transporter permease [Burkholderiaceae bacterium]|nr:ABC transporter permease [Burkholderiaceae bacterium]